MLACRTAAHAAILKTVLDADPELRPSVIVRETEALPGGDLAMYPAHPQHPASHPV